MNIDPITKASATWSLLCEPGDSMAGMLRRILGVEESLFEIRRARSVKDLLPLLPTDHFSSPAFAEVLTDSLECWQRRLHKVNVDRSLDVLASHNGFLITSTSKLWPSGLSDLGDSAPAAIWAIGNQDALINQKYLSVVGARVASNYGLGVTQDLVQAAVSKDFVIVSGGALGIDAKAHSSALDVRGRTIAIMAGGLDRLYPPRNLDLFDQIKHTGLIISEMPPGSSPARWRFLQRNRLIAAIGQATMVIEAGFKSGSINTAGHANELERPVGAIPGPINSTRSAGCHRLIKERRAELISTPNDLFDLLNLKQLEQERMSFGLSGYQWRALDGLSHFDQGVETVAINSGMSLNEAQFTLGSLEKLGLVIRTSNGWVKLSNTL